MRDSTLDPLRKEEVEKTLTHYLKKLPERDIQRIWTEPVGKFQNDAMLYCQERLMQKNMARENRYDQQNITHGF